MGIERTFFGITQEGDEVSLFTLSNSNDLIVKIINFGGRIVELHTPDSERITKDIVLGFGNLQDYERENPYFGSILGRYANRIAQGKLRIDGQEYYLSRNNNGNHLHGGDRGFDSIIWEAETISENKSEALRLTYLSPDGEENYPGNLSTTVTYSLNEENELRIDYQAVTDKKTVVNLSNHVYFDLAGEEADDILAHEMLINADVFTPIDANFIPTGEIRKVDGTPMDFRKPTPIGQRIESDYPQIQKGRGYDHNFVLNKNEGALSFAARVHEPKSGRVMEVYTTEPGMQFYTGNWLDGSLIGKNGKSYEMRDAFCLETQHFPDSPNKPNFPSTELAPGDEYKSATIYKFTYE